MFRLSFIVGTVFLAAGLTTVAFAAETVENAPSPSVELPEEACASIRSALNQLAAAERAEAFALNLGSSPGSSTAIIEARLATVLDRTKRLREVLHEVRHNAAPHDPRIEQCTKMGFHALVEAEKLTTNVEELLRSREIGETSPSDPVRSDAGPASAAQP